MEQMPANVWIAACAHQLQQRWRTMDPSELEAVAQELLHNDRLRAMLPADAAVDWLKPIEREEPAR